MYLSFYQIARQEPVEKKPIYDYVKNLVKNCVFRIPELIDKTR